MTAKTRRFGLELTLVLAAIVVLTGFAMAWRANAAEVSEPTAETVVVRVAPVRVWSSTATVTQGVRVDAAEDPCAPAGLTVLAPENCP